MKIKVLNIDVLVETTKFENYKVMLKESVEEMKKSANFFHADLNEAMANAMSEYTQDDLRELSSTGMKYFFVEEEVAVSEDIKENYKSISRMIERVSTDITRLTDLFSDIDRDLVYLDEVADQLSRSSDEDDRVIAKGLKYASQQFELSYYFVQQMLNEEYDILDQLTKAGRELSKQTVTMINVA